MNNAELNALVDRKIEFVKNMPARELRPNEKIILEAFGEPLTFEALRAFELRRIERMRDFTGRES